MTNVDLSSAYVQSGEIDEAARLLSAVGEIAARNSSARLIGMVKQAHADLRPWAHTTAVRTDGELRLTGSVVNRAHPPSGRGR